MKKAVIAAAAMMVSSQALAGWITGHSLKHVRSSQDTSAQYITRFTTHNGVYNQGNCPNTDHYVILAKYKPRESLAVLLTAYANSKPVAYFVTSECSFDGRPVVSDVVAGDLW